MSNDVRIRINIDSNSKNVVVLKDEVKKLGKVFNDVDSVADNFINRIEMIGRGFIGFQAIDKTLGNLIRTGVEFNSALETMKTGIGSLISVNSSNITTTGKTITALEKYTMSIANAGTVIDMLKVANKETSATLEELVVGFQAAVAPALNAGLSLKQTVEYTKLMTQAAGAMGMPMNQLSQELKSVVAGTIDLNSVVASNLGITNEEIKKAKEKGELYEFLQDKLKDFALAGKDVQNSLVGIKSELEDTYNDFASEFTKPLLEPYKNSLIGLNNTLNSLKDNLPAIQATASEIAKIGVAIGTTAIAYKTYNTVSAMTLAMNSYLVGSFGALNRSILLATASQVALNKLLKITPWGLAATAIYTIGESLLDSSKRADTFKASLSGVDLALGDIVKYKDRLKEVTIELEEMDKRISSYNNTQKLMYGGGYNTVYKEKQALITLTANKEAKTTVTQTMLDTQALKVKEQIRGVEENILAIRSNSNIAEANRDKIIVAREKQLSSLNKKLKDIQNTRPDTLSETGDLVANKTIVADTKNLKDKKDTLKDLQKAYLDIAQIGMSEYEKALFSITQQSNEWLKSGLSENEMLYAQGLLIDELNTKKVIDDTKEDLSYQERLLQLKSDSYEKELELANIAYSQKALDIQSLAKPIEDKERLLALETELYNKTLERLKIEDNIKQIEKESEDKLSLLEYQNSLIEATDSWGNSLKGVAGQIGNVLGAYNKMQKVAIASQAKQIKLDTDLSKVKEKFGEKSIEYVEAENKHIMDTSALKKEKQDAEIAGYANLAGVMASAFEQGSAGAIAFTTLQATLGIASSWTAIATAWALPFPSNLLAVAMVSSAVLPIIAQLTSMGGSGGSSGGGGSSSPYSLGELATAKITEFEDQTVVDRLDQQIKLLEAIERNGSAQKLGVDLARAEFEQEKNKWVQDIYDTSRMGYVYANFKKGDWESIQYYYNNKNLTNPFEMQGINIRIRSEYFRANPNELISVIADMTKMQKGAGYDYTGPFGQKLSKDLGFSNEAHSAFLAQIKSTFTELQGYVNDWAISVVDTVANLKDNAENMKDYYDELTGSSYYADKALTKAFLDFEKLLKSGETHTDFLSRTIDNIENSGKFMYEMSGILDENGKHLTNYELLLSKNANLIDAQISKVDEYSRVVNSTFTNGIEEALNYMESIEMVAETMAKSRRNINSFIESFRTDKDTLEMLAAQNNIFIANNFEDLVKQFNYLKSDIYGLTDEELDYLQRSKEYIEQKNEEILEKQKEGIKERITLEEEYLSTLANNISKLESIINSVTSTIDKLRGNVIGSSYTLDKFYKSMDESLRFSKNRDYDSLDKSLKDTISYSSSLFEKSNFKSLWDMQFAQVVAANQFEDIQTESSREIDYLKLIEENTKNTVESLKNELERVVETFTNSNSVFVDALGNFTNALGEKIDKGFNQSVMELYTKYDLHKLQSDSKGYEYWEKMLENGVSLAEIERNILIGMTQMGVDIPKELLSMQSGILGLGDVYMGSIDYLYDKHGLVDIKQDTKMYDYWEQLLKGGSSLQDVENSIKSLSSIYELYSKYDLHKFQTDQTGYQYWLGELNNGKSLVEIEKEIQNILKDLGIPIVNNSSNTGSATNNSSSSNNSNTNSNSNSSNSSTSSKELIYGIYSKYDLHKFQTDQTGYQYWEEQYKKGKSLLEIEKDIRLGAKIYLQGQNTQEAKNWLNIYPSRYSFAVGSANIPHDLDARLHKGELVLPTVFADSVRSGEINIGNNKEQIELLKEIKILLQRMDTNIENIDDRDEYILRAGA